MVDAMVSDAEHRDMKRNKHIGPSDSARARLAMAVLLPVALLAFFWAGGALVTGRPWLGNPTWLFGIPAGNLVAWVFVFALPFAAWMLLRHGTLGRAVMLLVLLGALWLPVSILLARNVSLNFQGGRWLLAWQVYTAACLFLPVVLMVGMVVVRSRAKHK